MKINVITLCSGMDSMVMGLKRLRADYPEFDFELLAWSEIADAPIKAHKACHPEYADRNLGDMSKIDWGKWWAEHGNPSIDMLFYSTPCTSVSCAGKNKGAEEGSGTESALIWYTKHAIRELHPHALICENVKGMVSGRNLKTFHKWQVELESYGYANYVSVLDARDYGVAQHRERLFMVSIAEGGDRYYFPSPFKLEKRLKDYLEKDVPEDYYPKAEQVANIISHCDKKQSEGCGFKTQFVKQDGVASTVTARYGQRETDPYIQGPKMPVPVNFNGYLYRESDTSQALTLPCGGKQIQYLTEPVVMQTDQLYPDSGNPQAGRGYDAEGVSPCLDTCTGGNRMPKILVPVVMSRPHGFFEGSESDIAPCVKASSYESNNYVKEPVGCAMRGRNPENPSDMTTGAPTQQRLEIGDAVSNCLTTVQKDSLVLEPSGSAGHEYRLMENGNIRAYNPKSKNYEKGVNGYHITNPENEAETVISSYPPRVYEKTESAVALPEPSVWVDPETQKAYYCKDGWLWRIRKLMPSECLRLMGLSEEDIKTICGCGISKTAIYSLAGNSIVVDVLYHIFHKLYIDKSNPDLQLTLF